jgi:hypothetical protein
MSEKTPRPELQAGTNEYDVDKLIELNELIQEYIDTAYAHSTPWSDGALDALSELSLSMTHRNPALGELLVTRLHERAQERMDLAPSEADQHQTLAAAVSRELHNPRDEGSVGQPGVHDSTGPLPGETPSTL